MNETISKPSFASSIYSPDFLTAVNKLQHLCKYSGHYFIGFPKPQLRGQASVRCPVQGVCDGRGYNSPARCYTWSAGDGLSFVSGVWIVFPPADHPSSQGPSKISWQSVIFPAAFRWECLKVFLSWCVGSALFCLNAMMTAGFYSETLVICTLQIP